MSTDDLSNLSLVQLFRMEVENQAAVLTDALLALEKPSGRKEALQRLMRAAHSIKGASRIAGRNVAVRVAHAMEEQFVTAQGGDASIGRALVDDLLKAVDLLVRISKVAEEEIESWDAGHSSEIDAFISALGQERDDAMPVATEAAAPAETKTEDRAVRVRAENLSRLLGLAGESVVSSRQLTELSQRGVALRRQERQVAEALDALREIVQRDASASAALDAVTSAHAEEREHIASHLSVLDEFERRSADLSARIYEEVLASRMRPFSDAMVSAPRLVRDAARALGKEAHLEIAGESTPIDRDIAEKLEAPLTHLLRNAVDHGIESPEERKGKGKPAEGTIRVEARHAAGMLLITIADDGQGIDVEEIRRAVIRRKLIPEEAAQNLGEAELLEFLFLPAFSMRDTVTEYSGRGVGLDVVQSTVREIGGHVRIHSKRGEGTEFQLELPLTLSVIRTVIVEIGGEPYALPLSRIERVLKVDRNSIASSEGRQHVTVNDAAIGLVTGHQILGIEAEATAENQVSIVAIGDRDARYGIVVDRFLGERDLVVRQLDPHLGKIQDIAAAALLDDGSPVLIIDVDDLLRSIDNLVSGGRLTHVSAQRTDERTRKRILVIDDSLTVRELERKLLASRGYEVEVAVDGMDGWNATRAGRYDLVVTDVDMPRMDGIELVTRIKGDARLKSTPVVIVSYKDREDDRRRGLEAGADYYLTKGSFQDETLVRAVADLIGDPV